MKVADQRTWLEDTIGAERDPEKLASVIAVHPKFQEIIMQSIKFAKNQPDRRNETRIVAEHIVFLMHQVFDSFITMHN